MQDVAVFVQGVFAACERLAAQGIVADFFCGAVTQGVGILLLESRLQHISSNGR